MLDIRLNLKLFKLLKRAFSMLYLSLTFCLDTKSNRSGGRKKSRKFKLAVARTVNFRAWLLKKEKFKQVLYQI
jgi:hypothetical protein